MITSSLPSGCCSVTMISDFLRRENRYFFKNHKFCDLILHPYCNLYLGASLVSQMVKNLPAVQETWVWSLGREDCLEKEMATHSSILACKIPWIEEPGSYSPCGCKQLPQLSNFTWCLTKTVNSPTLAFQISILVQNMLVFLFSKAFKSLNFVCYLEFV